MTKIGVCEVRKFGFTIVVIPARADNYMYLLEWPGGTALIDASDADVVKSVCELRNRRLDVILSTHHHVDHVCGNLELQSVFDCGVYGPSERIPGLTQLVGQDSSFPLGPFLVQPVATPGHTTDCLSYYLPTPEVVFTGDALFAGGCGRLFECEPSTMFESLSRLAALPSSTEVYCGHEYTESNLKFALSVSPSNVALRSRVADVRRALQDGRPSVPSTIGIELASNPFLRATTAAEFADLRRAKDQF